MKKKYSFHPNDYAIGATEKYYSDMAAKGWELEKRGGFLSRFKKTEPKRMKYRVEIMPSEIFDKEDETEEKLSIFDECGWKYITGCNNIHIFSAPENSNAPEFYLDPKQHADSLKDLKNRYIHHLIYLTLIFALNFRIWELFSNNSRSQWIAEQFCRFLENPILIILLLIGYICIYVDCIKGMYHIIRLSQKMKNGIPLDHSPKFKKFNTNLIGFFILIFALILMGLSLLPNETYPLPDDSNVPFILLSDISFDGSRTPGFMVENEYGYNHSLLAEHWYSGENAESSGTSEFLIQDVYLLKDRRMAHLLAESLMLTETLADSIDEFIEIEFDGLDHAWKHDRLPFIVAIKENSVYLIFHSFDSEEYTTAIFQAVVDKDYE